MQANRPDSLPLSSTTATFGGNLAEKLRAMRDAGFAATEFFPRDLFEDPRGPDFAVGMLRDSGLKVSAYQALRDYEGMPEAHRAHVLDVARQMMDQMVWLGTDLLVLCANVHPESSGERARCVDDLRVLAELGQSRGMRIAYEPIGWARWFADYRDAWSLVRAVDHPHFGLVLDSLHVAAHGLPLAGIDAIDPAKLFLVQVCDWPQTRLPQFEVARHYRLFPGEGVGPMTEFLARCRRLGHKAWTTVEIMNDHYRLEPPTEVARRARASLQALDVAS